jgi:hypothetical protein
MLGLPGDANSRQARVSLLLLPIFGFPHRKIHIKKKFRRNPKNNRSKKRMLEHPNNG